MNAVPAWTTNTTLEDHLDDAGDVVRPPTRTAPPPDRPPANDGTPVPFKPAERATIAAIKAQVRQQLAEARQRRAHALQAAQEPIPTPAAGGLGRQRAHRPGYGRLLLGVRCARCATTTVPSGAPGACLRQLLGRTRGGSGGAPVIGQGLHAHSPPPASHGGGHHLAGADRRAQRVATSACLARTASAAVRRAASSVSLRSRSTMRRTPTAPISASTPR